MASRSVSPGGALLRASRVFSMPPPLPRPTADLSSTGMFQSDTATLPYPIHQSIATPQSSLARGDWGFKRPLPLRATTRTSTPIIRVEAIDTYEHITEFGSAADHSITLQKWQEMGIPINIPTSKKSETEILGLLPSAKSVFEDSLDSSIVPTGNARNDESDTRWKFKGPWLAGVNEGEFNAFIESQVHGRKKEFREFLRSFCAASLTRDQRRKANEDEGETPRAVAGSDVTEAQLDAYIKTLRGDTQALFRLIRKFLDLPPVSNSLEMSTLTSNSPSSLFMSMSTSPYALTGPPKTHPSAGLGYSRTSAYISNHAVHGPQKHKTPIPARVVMPKNAAVGSFQPVLGVGGFIAPVPRSVSFKNVPAKFKIGASAKESISGLENIEPDKSGGSKTWVQPMDASINSKGKLVMSVAMAHPEAVSVKLGKTDEIPALYQNDLNLKPKPPMMITRKGGSKWGYGNLRQE